MNELATSVLAYTLWPLLTLATVVLWAAAVLDISRHKGRETFTNKRLLGMAAAVSAISVFAIAIIYAVCAGQWSEAVSTSGANHLQAADQRDTYVFSFGLQQEPDKGHARQPGTE